MPTPIPITLSPNWEQVFHHLRTGTFSGGFRKAAALEVLTQLQDFQKTHGHLTLERDHAPQLYQRLRQWQLQQHRGTAHSGFVQLLRLLGLPAYRTRFHTTKHLNAAQQAHRIKTTEALLSELMPHDLHGPAHERRPVTAWWHCFWHLRDHVAQAQSLNMATLPEQLATFYSCHLALAQYNVLTPAQTDAMRTLLQFIPPPKKAP